MRNHENVINFGRKSPEKNLEQKNGLIDDILQLQKIAEMYGPLPFEDRAKLDQLYEQLESLLPEGISADQSIAQRKQELSLSNKGDDFRVAA